MVIWFENITTQGFVITPRKHDAPIANYVVKVEREGVSETQELIPGAVVIDGNRMTLDLDVSVVRDNYYYFSVYRDSVDSPEIYKGKAFCVPGSPPIIEPLKYSQYDGIQP